MQEGSPLLQVNVPEHWHRLEVVGLDEGVNPALHWQDLTGYTKEGGEINIYLLIIGISNDWNRNRGEIPVLDPWQVT